MKRPVQLMTTAVASAEVNAAVGFAEAAEVALPYLDSRPIDGEGENGSRFFDR